MKNGTNTSSPLHEEDIDTMECTLAHVIITATFIWILALCTAILYKHATYNTPAHLSDKKGEAPCADQSC